MESLEDKKNHQTNLMYFNQMVEEKGIKKKYAKREPKKIVSSFGAQKVELSDYLMAQKATSQLYTLFIL